MPNVNQPHFGSKQIHIDTNKCQIEFKFITAQWSQKLGLKFGK